MIGYVLGMGFFLFMMWWVMHPTVFEKRWAEEDKAAHQHQPLLDRKARFKAYVEGEKQLMLDWEDAYDPEKRKREALERARSEALARDLGLTMRRVKDEYAVTGNPYKPTRIYNNPTYSTWDDYMNKMMRGPHA